MDRKKSFIMGAAAALGIVLFSYLSLVFDLDINDYKEVLEAFNHFDKSDSEHVIIYSRFSRILGALLLGIGLAVSGLIMQLVTKNKLASSDIIGISDGSALFICLCFVLFPHISVGNKILVSIAGSMISLICVLYLSQKFDTHRTPYILPLVGIIFGTFLNSITLFISNYFQLSQSVLSWYNNRLYRLDLSLLKWGIIPIGLSIICLLIVSRYLNVLAVGDGIALNLGVPVKSLKGFLVLQSAILTGVTVALVGRVSFVGLIVPHIIKLTVKNDYKYLLPLTILYGGLLVLISDYVSRWLNYPYETPVGLVINLIGVPFFLVLVNKGRQMG